MFEKRYAMQPFKIKNNDITLFSLKNGTVKIFKVLLIYNISYTMVYIFPINSY